MSKILVVDDEPTMLAAFQEILGELEHEVVTAQHAETAMEQLRCTQIDLVILDVRLPGMGGLDALRHIKRDHPKVPIIVMTGHGTMNTAIEATKLGAFDYHLKPIEPEAMLATIDKALAGARLMRRAVTLGAKDKLTAGDAIIGQSAAMQEIYKAIGRVAETEAGVLIRGESGTGKELVARAIYQHSLRANKPMIVVNCAAIPETLLESELFGHERGAFTGAVGERIGKFEQATDGTLFLDEIGDIPLAIQVKLLRVLQDGSFQRLGGNETLCSNARLLAATNRDLETMIPEGRFREDLFHRLNVFAIFLPPLRERRDDIPDLVAYFLHRCADELRIDKPVVSPDAMETLQTHAWPGNVRELEHCIQRLLISTGGHPIQAADISAQLAATQQLSDGELPDDDLLRNLVERYLNRAAGNLALERLIRKIESLLITEALRRTKGNQTHAARLLGLPRQTLFDKLHKYRLAEDGGASED
ncbi:MAG: sigma-54-dependent Fis family transcriptional regulator [Planctomycetes bacterium]|nr:sigma-54-dependent Fis family transcriptional regulator [Planctomycetota bacterium]